MFEFTKKNELSKKKLFFIFVFIGAAIVGLYALFVGFGSNGNAGPDWLWPDDDPFDGEVYSWSKGFITGTGLSITLLNALQEEWHPYFDISVSEWNNGEPDVLNLRDRVAEYDPDCSPLQGTIKVCNNDYGETWWKGLNSALLRGEDIVASVALMNDYYLKSSTSDDREYTMCHEIGHGLGLPHTDERFWNINQGNCMDYTNWPKNNKKPGKVSFDRLAEIYGFEGLQQNQVAAASSAATQDQGEDVDAALKAFQIVTSDVQDEPNEIEIVDIGAGYTVIMYRMLV